MKPTSEQDSKSKNKKKSTTDKSLYPALNNQINQNNIIDYFVFDEDEDNIMIDSKKNKNKINEGGEEEKNNTQNIKVDYNVNSFITSSYRPDLYSPYGIISGNIYKLSMQPGKSSQKLEEVEDEENEEEEKEAKKEEDKDSLSSISEKEINDEIKKVKINRYFNLEQDISIKCHICDQVGHRMDVCPFSDIKFCYKCLSSKHDDRDCNQVKCFRCHKLGHRTYNCQLKDSQLIICERCHCTGHKSNECLIKPMEFSHKFLKYNNMHCLRCGNKKHVLCSLAERELPILLNEDEDENEIFNDEELNLLNNENKNENDEDDDRSSLTPLNEELEEKDNIKEEINNDNKADEKKKKKKKEKKNIFEDLKNEDIKFTLFCGFCGGRHRNQDCPEPKDEKFNNKFDEQRKNMGKRIFDSKRKEEEREKEERKQFIEFQKRNRERESTSKKKRNQDTKFNNKNKYKNNYNNNNNQNKYKNNSKDKNKYRNNSNDKNNYKNIPLNEDDMSENENNYNGEKRKNNYKNKSKNKSNNKNVSKFSWGEDD